MEQQAMPDKTGQRPLAVERIAFTTAEAARAAGVNPATIYRAIARGKLRASKYIRHKRILRTELERWLLGEPIPGRHRSV